jgi:hypothetical protein
LYDPYRLGDDSEVDDDPDDIDADDDDPDDDDPDDDDPDDDDPDDGVPGPNPEDLPFRLIVHPETATSIAVAARRTVVMTGTRATGGPR